MVSKTTILIISLACGAAALVSIVIIVSVYLWKQKQKKMKISDDKSLDSIESVTGKDKQKTGEGTSKDVTNGLHTPTDVNETNKSHKVDAGADAEKDESKKREMYPSFVTLFQVGNENNSEHGNERNSKKRSKSMREKAAASDKMIKDESDIKRNKTFSFPVKTTEKFRRSLDRNDSLVNTFIDRGKTDVNDNNLFSYTKKEASHPLPKMTLSRTPSRCWEDLSADLENLNNLEGSSDSEDEDLENNNANGIITCNKLSDTSTSDNMSYVVDPIEKSFVLTKTKQKCNSDGNKDIHTLTSDESDLESEPGVSEHIDSNSDDNGMLSDGSDEQKNSQTFYDGTKQLTNVNKKHQNDDSPNPKRNHYQTYHFSTSVSQSNCELHDTLTEVREYQDPITSSFNDKVASVSINRPKTPQSTKENEIKRITNLSRCKSIPSNTRLNFTPRFKSPSPKNDDFDTLNHSMTEDEKTPSTEIDPVTNVIDMRTPKVDLKTNLNTPEEALLSDKDKREAKPVCTEEAPANVHVNERVGNPLNKVFPQESVEESYIRNENSEEMATSLNLVCQNDTTYKFTEERNYPMSQVTLNESMKVLPSDKDALAGLRKTPVTEDSNTGPSQYPIQPPTVYPSSLLASSGSRKRKHSATRAPTPVPTIDAKPKRGILKKLAEQKRLLQIRLPDENEPANEDDDLMKERSDQSNDAQRDLQGPVKCENITRDRSINDINDLLSNDDEYSYNNVNKGMEFNTKQNNNQVTCKDTMRLKAENCMVAEDELNDIDKVITVESKIQDNIETMKSSPNKQPQNCDGQEENSYANANSYKPVTVFPKEDARDRSHANQNVSTLPKIVAAQGTSKTDPEVNTEQNARDITSERKNIQVPAKIDESNHTEFKIDRNEENVLAKTTVEEASESNIPMFDSMKELQGESSEPDIKQMESEFFEFDKEIEFEHQLDINIRECTSNKDHVTIETKKIEREPLMLPNMSIHLRNQVGEGSSRGNLSYIQNGTIEQSEKANPDPQLEHFDPTADRETFIDADSNQIGVNKSFKYHTQKRRKESLIEQISDDDDDCFDVGRGNTYKQEKFDSDANSLETVMNTANDKNQEPRFSNDIESYQEKHITDTSKPIMKVDRQKGEQSDQQLKEVDRNSETPVMHQKDKIVVVHNDAELGESKSIIATACLPKEKTKRSKSFAGQMIKDTLQTPPFNQDKIDHGHASSTEPCTTGVPKNEDVQNSTNSMVVESDSRPMLTVTEKTGRFSTSKQYARQQLGMLEKSALFMDNSLNEGGHHTVDQRSTRDSKQNSSIDTFTENIHDGVSGTDSTSPSSPSILPNKDVTRRKTIHVSNFEASQSLLSLKLPSLQKGLRETDLRTKPSHFQTSPLNSMYISVSRNENFKKKIPVASHSFDNVPDFKDSFDKANSFKTNSLLSSFGGDIKRGESLDSQPPKNMHQEAPNDDGIKEKLSNARNPTVSSLRTLRTPVSSDISLKRNETFHTAMRPETRHNRNSAMRSKSLRKQDLFPTSGQQEQKLRQSGTLAVEKSDQDYGHSKPKPTFSNETMNSLQTVSTNIGSQQSQKSMKISSQTEHRKGQTDDELIGHVINSEKRTVQDRPSSSYGRSRPRSFKESPDKSVSRRPTTAADLITTKRTGLRRSKDKKHNLYASNDTLSDTSQISDDFQEIVPIDKPVTNQSANLIHQTELKMQKPLSSQTKLLKIETGSTSVGHLDNLFKFEDAVKPNEELKPDHLKYYPIKNDLTKRKDSHSVQRMHEKHRSSTPINENVNRADRENTHGHRIINHSNKQSLSITDQIKDKLASTFPAKRSNSTTVTTDRGQNTREQNKIDRFSGNARLSSEKVLKNLTRAMTIGHSDRFPVSNNQVINVGRPQTPAVGERDKLQYRYDVKSILESAEIFKSRQRYSHNMRTKSFNYF